MNHRDAAVRARRVPRRKKRNKTEGAEVMDLSYRIIGAAMEVHRVLGAGYLESVYGDALAVEFEECGILFDRELEAADRSVSIDLLIKSLLALGATREDIAAAIAGE
jgi:PD-(D/E)XK nuclease superfamily